MRIAVVTGANRGLGLEVCRQLTNHGHHVILTSRQAEAGQATATKLGLEFRHLDVTDPGSVAAFADRVRERHGRVDILVNSAGVALDGFDLEVVRHTLAVNFYGAVRVTDALRDLLSDDARIVNVSSQMGQMACLGLDLVERFNAPDLTQDELMILMQKFVEDVAFDQHLMKGWPSSAYRVSKVGLNAYTRVLARELEAKESKIRVNAVCPGSVRTDMGGPSAEKSVREGADTIVWAAELDKENPPTGQFFFERQPIRW